MSLVTCLGTANRAIAIATLKLKTRNPTVELVKSKAISWEDIRGFYEPKIRDEFTRESFTQAVCHLRHYIITPYGDISDIAYFFISVKNAQELGIRGYGGEISLRVEGCKSRRSP